jgi:chemotaxis protein CheZ
LLKLKYGARVRALAEALERDEHETFETVLDDILQSHKPQVVSQLSDLTCNLQLALDRFRLDSRLSDLAEKDIPDARQRLAHVLKMTDEAAHKTLDLVEQSAQPADRTARSAVALGQTWSQFRTNRIGVGEFCTLLEQLDAFLPQVRQDAELIQRNLTEVLLTQGYQDLTGQIIRSVMMLVEELETILANLPQDLRHDSNTGFEPSEPGNTNGFGPAVPGICGGDVAAGQQDVDALLSGLGF